MSISFESLANRFNPATSESESQIFWQREKKRKNVINITIIIPRWEYFYWIYNNIDHIEICSINIKKMAFTLTNRYMYEIEMFVCVEWKWNKWIFNFKWKKGNFMCNATYHIIWVSVCLSKLSHIVQPKFDSESGNFNYIIVITSSNWRPAPTHVPLLIDNFPFVSFRLWKLLPLLLYIFT